MYIILMGKSYPQSHQDPFWNPFLDQGSWQLRFVSNPGLGSVARNEVIHGLGSITRGGCPDHHHFDIASGKLT